MIRTSRYALGGVRASSCAQRAANADANAVTPKKGGAWTAISFYWAFFFLPFADFVVGVDTFNKRDNEYSVLRDRWEREGEGR